MSAKAGLDEYVSVVRRRRQAWTERIERWDGSWFKVRFALFLLSLLGLFYTYKHLPHRGADPLASRYQTLTLTVQTVGKSRTAYDAFTNLQYLNVNYEDPGLYWLIQHVIAVGKVFEPGWLPSESLIYPLQLGIFAVALLMLSWRPLPLNIFASATAVFFLAFSLSIFYWSWDVYWAPALAVLLTMVVLLSATAWSERGKWPWIAAAAYGLLVGLLGVIRQDSAVICQAAALAFVLCLFFYWFVMKGKDSSRRVLAQAALLIICFTGATFVPRLVFSSEVSVVQWIAPPQPPIVGNLEHGKWHNLYLGIGFNMPPYASPSNPYGIAWDDAVGALHAVEEDPAAQFGTPRYMPTLRTLFMKVIYDDPAFFIGTVRARAYAELSMIYSAVPREARVTRVLYLWPLIFLTFLLHSGRRSVDGVIYVIIAVTAFIPPVLTFPSPSYSTAIGLALVGNPLFFAGSFLEKSRRPVHFSLAHTRLLAAAVVLSLLVATAAFASFASEARASNDRFLRDLLGPSTDVLSRVASASWRVDRHFNYSLSAPQRQAVSDQFKQAQGEAGSASNASIIELPGACLHITSVIRLPGRIAMFVKANANLDYAIFALNAEGTDQVFYRKALDWSPSQTYMLIFNTGALDTNVRSFKLKIKEHLQTFTTDPGKAVAQITFVPGS
jgi:hypothetical protein